MMQSHKTRVILAKDTLVAESSNKSFTHGDINKPIHIDGVITDIKALFGTGTRQPKECTDYTGTKSNNSSNKVAHSNKSFSKVIFSCLNEPDQKTLDNFDIIIDQALQLTSKQKQSLSKNIETLSKLLTTQRTSRHLSYMNSPIMCSAYIYYFMWWNLVRLTALMPATLKNCCDNFCDGDFIIDFGAGPLTVACALWLSLPELRSKKLNFYCVDISQNILDLGEKIFNRLVLKTASYTTQQQNWKIIKVHGSFGVPLTAKARLVTFSNMFNEVQDFLSDLSYNNINATKVARDNNAHSDHGKKNYNLLDYISDNATVMVLEPGDNVSGEFIAKTRGTLLAHQFVIDSPCTHCQPCPMPGVGSHHGGKIKWCNFAFKVGFSGITNNNKKMYDVNHVDYTNKKRKNSLQITSKVTTAPKLNDADNLPTKENCDSCHLNERSLGEDYLHAPPRLLRLSEKAHLRKTRCALSFIVATRRIGVRDLNGELTQLQCGSSQLASKPLDCEELFNTSDSKINEDAHSDKQQSELKIKTQRLLLQNKNSIMHFRVTSDIIKLPWGECGYYACAQGELYLLIVYRSLCINCEKKNNSSAPYKTLNEECENLTQFLHNGDEVVASLTPRKTRGRDKKTGAIIIRLAINKNNSGIPKNAIGYLKQKKDKE